MNGYATYARAYTVAVKREAEDRRPRKIYLDPLNRKYYITAYDVPVGCRQIKSPADAQHERYCYQMDY